jgi:Fe-S-cluster-containing hydrogenase component 2
MMKQGVSFTGVPCAEELESSPGYPPREELERRPLAVIECVQEIPCNPCETACPTGAIIVGEPITNLPSLDTSKCTGCGLCLAICPGQAIFRVDLTYSSDQATVSFPYEFLPLPRKGDLVVAVDREGRLVCDAIVLRVLMPAAYDRTAVVTLVVPKEHGARVRSIRRINRTRA